MNPPPETIGLIGVGLMGSAVAQRLGVAGFTVLGWDRDATRCQGAATAHEVFTQCRRILISLPTYDVVNEVLHLASLRQGQILIDTSTGDPAQAEALGRDLAAKGVAYLDATVSGSSEQVTRGEVLVMAGGDGGALNDCKHLLATFAKDILHTGPCGSGAKMKLVTNLVLGLNRAALAEGLCLARHLDVEPAKALEVLRASAARSAVMDAKGRKMVEGDFAPQARLAQHHKDVRLMLATGADLPLTQTHDVLLSKAEALGFAEADNSAIIRAFD